MKLPRTAKLNRRGRDAFQFLEMGLHMEDDVERLVERWILAFCEPPPLVDAELMRRMLADHAEREQAR